MNISKKILFSFLILVLVQCGSGNPLGTNQETGQLLNADAYHGFGIYEWRGFGKGYWFWCGIELDSAYPAEAVSVNYIDGNTYELNDSGQFADETAGDGYWSYMQGLTAPPPQGEIVITVKYPSGTFRQAVLQAGTPPSSVPEFTFPTNDLVTADSLPTFTWNSFPEADYYGLSVYESNDFTSSTLIWRKWFIDSSTRSVAYNDDNTAKITHLQTSHTYWLELFAHRPGNSMGVRSIRFHVQ